MKVILFKKKDLSVTISKVFIRLKDVENVHINSQFILTYQINKENTIVLGFGLDNQAQLI